MEKTKKVKEYFDNTDSYIKENPIIQLRKKIINELLGDIKDKQIIDIGCGNGELSKDFIYTNRITFIDISEKMLDLVKLNIPKEQLNHASFVNSDILNFCTDQAFDLVICVGVIAHVEDISGLLDKIKELSTDDGIIILQYSASEKLISKFNQLRNGLCRKDICHYHINFTSSLFINKLLFKTGLNIIKKAKYLPVSPLFSIFSYRTKIKYLNFFYKSKLFAFLDSEIILYLSKASKV
jgi:cyclopropane fatty-acyl-phospholipid synthase-like methyltransferase